MTDPVSPDRFHQDPVLPADPVEALGAVGWSDRVAASFASARADGVPARVVRVDRDRCLVSTSHGESTASAQPLPAVGDWVVLRPEPESNPPFVVNEVLPRWSALTRHRAGRATVEQVLAANVDIVAVVAALDHPVNHARLDRELVMAWDTAGRPIVILAKADACRDPQAAASEVAERHGGVDVIVTSALHRSGIAAVASAIGSSETIVLLGASGVGKSTLANALLGHDALDTGAVREGYKKGRHTTSARHLLALPLGGVLIDTPGVRSLGLYDVDEGIALTFPDIDALIEQCRFTNCAHAGDAGCAIAAAVDDGSLDPERLVSWEKLQRELARVEAQRDGRALAESHKAARRFARSIRDQPHR